jgi:hypothetical protein
MRWTYRVSSNVDVLLCAVLDELRLEKAGVTLDLVGRRCDTGAVNERLEMLFGVVGNTNSSCLLLVKLSHGLPCVDN